MERNYLKMNDNKTTAVIATPPRHFNYGITLIKLGECDVTPSPSARNIEVVSDSGMSMELQVAHVCQIACWHPHTIPTARSSITPDDAVKRPGLLWPVGDMHLTSFPFTSECEKFHVTNGQPWPIGDSTNIIYLIPVLSKVEQLLRKVVQVFEKVVQLFRKVV